MGLGWGEMIMIMLIFLLLFGANKIPLLARSLGQGVGEFKKGLRDGQQDPPQDQSTPPPPAAH